MYVLNIKVVLNNVSIIVYSKIILIVISIYLINCVYSNKVKVL